MNTKHTPGPWALRRARGHVYVRAEHDAEIARMGGENVLADDSSAAANARLIAAAPELLQALENLCRLSIWNGASDYDREQVNKARAAIAKATGSASGALGPQVVARNWLTEETRAAHARGIAKATQEAQP